MALRVGNEKSTEEEADTVGCCSLRVKFDFLGKDSMPYKNEVKVTENVWKNLRDFT